MRGRWAWLGTGLGACLASLVFVPNLALAIVGAPLAVLGAWLAGQILEVVAAPRRRSVVITAVLLDIAMPVVSGAVDLFFRTHTA